MEYEGRICRAPMERASYMLPVMVGCSYNKCKFCNLFRDLKYRELPLEQVEEELQRVKNLGGNPRKIFLGDGNAFGLKMDRLRAILDLIDKYFPDCQMINMDATVTSIRLKSDEELQELYDRKVRHLYLGIESGLDDVLKFMRKEHTQDQAYKEIARIQKVGLIFDAHVMSGVAGKGRGQENAIALAEFLNKTQPDRIVNFSLFLHNQVALYEDIKSGAFIPADEVENMEEERTLIELLKEGPDGHQMLYDGFNDFLELRVKGKVPKDAPRMIEKLTEAIEKYKGEPPIYAYVKGDCPDLSMCDVGCGRWMTVSWLSIMKRKRNWDNEYKSKRIHIFIAVRSLLWFYAIACESDLRGWKRDSGSIIFKVCPGNHSAVHLPESAESSDGAICGGRKKDFVCDGVWLWHHSASFV